MHGPEVQASARSAVLVLTRRPYLRVSDSPSSCEVNDVSCHALPAINDKCAPSCGTVPGSRAGVALGNDVALIIDEDKGLLSPAGVTLFFPDGYVPAAFCAVGLSVFYLDFCYKASSASMKYSRP